MTLEEIDKLLADWKKKIDLVGQNLIDLHGLPTYQRLAGVSDFPKVQLTGVTQARLHPALEAMNDLFGYFDLLVLAVDKATQLRTSVIPPFLVSQQKLQEIAQILTKPSIQLAVVQTPLAERGLLSAAETTHAIAPQELLVRMKKAFNVAKEAVLAIDEAWSRLQPMLGREAEEIQNLQKLADSLGVDISQELSGLSQKIASLRDSIESDPLGVTADFTREIQPQIARVKMSLQQMAKQQQLLRESFARANQLQSQLVELHRQATAAFAESTLKVVDHSMLQTPISREEIQALASWLSRLETKFAEGLVNPVQVGLENWTAKVKEYIGVVEKAYAANKAPLETRSELRGRLEALKAKALARGLAENATLTKLAIHAQQLLYSRPTPLNQAAELVSQYERTMNYEL
ncbi:MAG: hypothetical protein DSM106950_31565 [Stigonema ocellatum SAG 48.90 = DSM 106950]|nr:hypothetical protein [Stigonema ocellatum SAG 48.90 = DSM 106950]